jgi:hypothetical protein
MKLNTFKDLFDLDTVELKIVRIFLLAFVILLIFQAVQFINTRSIDRKHSELMVVKNQSFEALQNLLVQSSTIQRKMLNLAMTEDPEERKELLTIIRNAAISNDESLAALEAACRKIEPANTTLEELKTASSDYLKTYNTFETLILKGDNAAALEYKNTNLRPSYENYQDLQQKMLVSITNDLIQQSNKVSSYTTKSGWILFFLGLAPFIYAIAKLVYLSVLLKYKSSQVSIQQETLRHKD